MRLNLMRIIEINSDSVVEKELVGSFLPAGVSHQKSPPSFQIESQLPETAHNAGSESECHPLDQKTMRRKHLFLAIAALLAAGGLWLGRSAWRSDHFASHKSSIGVGFNSSTGVSFKTSHGRPTPGQMLHSPNPGHTLAPPNPTRRFTEFTPEQRVEFARRGHGPGG